MTDITYTIINFAPAQGFIEKSRKLRDLYGSSFILSYLADTVCRAAKDHLNPDAVVSPFLIDTAQGTPNQIVIRGDFPKKAAEAAFYKAWKGILRECREWLEGKLPESKYGWRYFWKKDWEQWGNYAWEFFWAQGEAGETISDVRQRLNNVKRSRHWVGINWMGESSTLSGTDAIAWYGLGQQSNNGQRISPKERNAQGEKDKIREFYRHLADLLPTFIDANEQLSIPELVKRVVMYPEVAKRIPGLIPPERYTDLSRGAEDAWKGWFMGDGDSVGKYLQQFANSSQEEAKLREFSQLMREWGDDLTENERYYIPNGRFIYAGGDDFMGVFYPNSEQATLSPQDCLEWFYQFPTLWHTRKQKPISASIGFVWASPQVPQRDILQHCREAEQSAKDHGRDRLAIRILFSGGNALEWVCPWWFLKDVLESYRDRNGDQGSSKRPKWTHIYNDVAILEARHAFEGEQSDVALALFEVYFGKENCLTLEQHLWDTDLPVGAPPQTHPKKRMGILGNQPDNCPDPIQAMNDWVIGLAKVGFHLFSSY